MFLEEKEKKKKKKKEEGKRVVVYIKHTCAILGYRWV